MAEGAGRTPEMSDVTRLLDAGASFVRTGETGVLADRLPPIATIDGSAAWWDDRDRETVKLSRAPV